MVQITRILEDGKGNVISTEIVEVQDMPPPMITVQIPAGGLPGQKLTIANDGSLYWS